MAYIGIYIYMYNVQEKLRLLDTTFLENQHIVQISLLIDITGAHEKKKKRCKTNFTKKLSTNTTIC